MQRILAALALTALAGPVAADQAYWSGDLQYVSVIGGGMGIKCGYMYQGQRFSRVFAGSNCPNEVEVNIPQPVPQSGSFQDCSFVDPAVYMDCRRA